MSKRIRYPRDVQTREFNFTCISPVRSLDAIAARRAVIYPLAPATWKRQGVPAAGAVVLRRWRKQLSKWQASGSARRLSSYSAMRNAWNCLPATYRFARGGAHICRFITICPWCQARRAAKVYRNIETTLRPGDKLHVYMRCADTATENPSEVRRTGSDWAKSLWGLNRQTSFAKNGGGVYWQTGVAPSRQKGKRWRLTVRVLALVPVGAAFRFHADWMAEDFGDAASSRNLVRAVSRVCRYPTGILKAPANLSLPLLSVSARDAG